MVCWLQTQPIQPQSWKLTWLNQRFSCVCWSDDVQKPLVGTAGAHELLGELGVEVVGGL